jgi:hypothetical protein
VRTVAVPEHAPSMTMTSCQADAPPTRPTVPTTNIISKPTDVHQHTLRVTRSGSLVIQATPATYSGVDVMLELKDSKFNTFQNFTL